MNYPQPCQINGFEKGSVKVLLSILDRTYLHGLVMVWHGDAKESFKARRYVVYVVK